MPGSSSGWRDCKIEGTGLCQKHMTGAHMTDADKLNKEEEEMGRAGLFASDLVGVGECFFVGLF